MAAVSATAEIVLKDYSRDAASFFGAVGGVRTPASAIAGISLGGTYVCDDLRDACW